MDDFFSHAAVRYPYAIQQLSGFPSYCPGATQIIGQITTGAGGGFGVDSAKAAFGEFIERSHFYNEVKSDVSGKIHDFNDQNTATALYKMIAQLQTDNEDVKSHRFKLTKVNNIFSNDPVYVPSVLISLSLFDENDRQFIPFGDSCGCAVHTTPQTALYRALKEFIERQSLVGAWLTKQYIYKIDAAALLQLPKHQQLASALLENGEFHIYDVSVGLPGYAIIIFYFSHSTIDFVQYAVGMAADLSPAAALAKAFNEFWLDYGYIYISAGVWSDISTLPTSMRYTILHAQDNNTAKTKSLIPFNLSHPSNINADEFYQLPVVAVNELFDGLREISAFIFSYQTKDYRGDYHYCKILSPDFFLHMSINESLNTNNNYANRLRLKDMAPVKSRIPFP